ncbi:MAG: prepilin-type N-terminal cleavage/methylation domain-containing protein [Clostridiaceae bacterium]|nr:prepilin-type N-terminal cleavage/methylation domain-containing protein [Clostridiaceae bacterium]
MKSLATLRKNKKGFTLVEVIVVLVILAILAAILVPSLTGYIDKANQRAAIAECRACVMAAQTLASEDYALKPTTATCTTENIAKLAEVPEDNITAFTVGTVEPDVGKITVLTYKATSGQIIYYTLAGGYSTTAPVVAE